MNLKQSKFQYEHAYGVCKRSRTKLWNNASSCSL
jgi:hypothetical protein